MIVVMYLVERKPTYAQGNVDITRLYRSRHQKWTGSRGDPYRPWLVGFEPPTPLWTLGATQLIKANLDSEHPARIEIQCPERRPKPSEGWTVEGLYFVTRGWETKKAKRWEARFSGRRWAISFPEERPDPWLEAGMIGFIRTALRATRVK